MWLQFITDAFKLQDHKKLIGKKVCGWSHRHQVLSLNCLDTGFAGPALNINIRFDALEINIPTNLKIPSGSLQLVKTIYLLPHQTSTDCVII